MEKKFQFTIPDPLGGPEIIYEGFVEVKWFRNDFNGYIIKKLLRDGRDILPELRQLTPRDRATFEDQLTAKIGY